jgi:hypothetical protein
MTAHQHLHFKYNIEANMCHSIMSVTPPTYITWISCQRALFRSNHSQGAFLNEQFPQLILIIIIAGGGLEKYLNRV